MANGGGPRILPALQQQPGALQQFTQSLQQNLPQLLQQLSQQADVQQAYGAPQQGGGTDDLLQNIQKMIQNIPEEEGQQAAMGQAPGQAPQDTTQQMLSSLQQMGAGQQGPQQAAGNMLMQQLQQQSQGGALEDILQQITGQDYGTQQGVGLTPQQQASRQHAQMDQEMQERNLSEHPSPKDAKKRPTMTKEQLTDLYDALKNDPAQEVRQIEKEKQRVKSAGIKDPQVLQSRIKELNQQEKEAKNRQQSAAKEQRQFIKDVDDKRKNAQQEINTLNQLEAISRRMGATGTAKEVGKRLLTTLGKKGTSMAGIKLNYDWTSPTDPAEFDAQAKELFRGMKDMFGGRINEEEVKLWMNRIPKATQRPELRNRIIDNMRKTNELAVRRADIKDEIIRANNFKLPENLDTLVDMYDDQLQQEALQQWKSIIQEMKQIEEEEGGQRQQEISQSFGRAFNLARGRPAGAEEEE